MKVTTTKQREAYLSKATIIFTKAWIKKGVSVPADVQVSCGFPGGGSVFKRIGECWPRARSAGKVNQVFINPTQSDTVRVLGVLGHELIHAADDCKSGHRGLPCCRECQQPMDSIKRSKQTTVTTI